jgi:hypothetical protein
MGVPCGLESKIDLAITGGMFGDDAFEKKWRLIKRI